MKLHHPINGNRSQIVEWVEAVVEGAHVHVVDVEQDEAAGATGDLRQAVPLREIRFAVGEIAGDILEDEWTLEEILYDPHSGGYVLDRLLGIGKRQQIVCILAAYPGPAQVVGHPCRLN